MNITQLTHSALISVQKTQVLESERGKHLYNPFQHTGYFTYQRN